MLKHTQSQIVKSIPNYCRHCKNLNKTLQKYNWEEYIHIQITALNAITMIFWGNQRKFWELILKDYKCFSFYLTVECQVVVIFLFNTSNCMSHNCFAAIIQPLFTIHSFIVIVSERTYYTVIISYEAKYCSRH